MVRSEFDELSPSHCPRFGVSKSSKRESRINLVQLKAIPTSLTFVRDFKIQFGFQDHRFEFYSSQYG
jgi:hypothetical protein